MGARRDEGHAEAMSSRAKVASMIRRVGRAVALTGVLLPLLLIGGLKFTQLEIDALNR